MSLRDNTGKGKSIKSIMVKLPGRSLVTRVLLLFTLFNILSLALMIFFVIQQDRGKTKEMMEESIREITNEKARVISMSLSQVAYDVENLANWAEEDIRRDDSVQLLPEYYKDREGILRRKLYRDQDPAACTTIFFPADINLDEKNIRIINATEKLDPIFVSAQERSGIIQWTYISTEQGLLRLLPYIDLDMYEKDHQQKGDPFYVIANVENDPQRETVWTTPYADFLGTGWMVSCSHPIYLGDEFLGVASSDVSLPTLQNEFLTDFRIADSGIAYLLGDSGEIIYHPDYVDDNRDSEEYIQGQMLLMNILDDPSLTNGERGAIQTMLSEKSGIVRFRGAEGGSLIAFAPIDNLPWILGIEVRESEYMAVNGIQSFNAFLSVIVLVILLIAFSSFLYRHYTLPMARFVNQAEMIAEGRFSAISTESNISEIETLAKAFNVMNEKVADYTENLLRTNKEIESIISSINGMLMILTPEYEIRALNKRGFDYFRERDIEPVGMKCYNAIFGAEGPCANCMLKDTVLFRKPLYSKVAVGNQVFYNDYFPIERGQTDLEEVAVHSQNATNRVMMEKELLQTEKLAGIGQLSSAISHELKNPLAVIKGALCLMDIYTETPEPEQHTEIREAISTADSAVKSAEKIVYNLLDFSGKAQDEIQEADIGQIVEQILLLFTKDRVSRDLTVNAFFAPNPLIYHGYVEPLKSILLNVITNGFTALRSGGALTISGCYTDGAEGIKLIVEDNGAGIAEENLESLFEPFFTTDPGGRGTGLGLWITRLLLEKMRGSITVESSPGEGAKFTILIPQGREEQKEKNNNDE